MVIERIYQQEKVKKLQENSAVAGCITNRLCVGNFQFIVIWAYDAVHYCIIALESLVFVYIISGDAIN